MIAAIKSENLEKIVISTGDILTSKLGRKSDEELIDSLKLTLCDAICNEQNVERKFEAGGKVLRGTADLKSKLNEHERTDLIVGAKIFLNKINNGPECIKAAIENMLEILDLEHVDNVVLAYHPEPRENCNTTPTTPVSAEIGGLFKWNSRTEATVEQLMKLWTTLEEFALAKKIKQLGVSNLDAETLKQLHEAARVKPSIAQINLTTCCVVPPELQEFCTQNDIRLLTHSDPEALFPINEQFIVPEFKADWTLRYQVHVRCRGVLTAKGFLVGASKK